MTEFDRQADITSWLDNAGRFPLLPAERVNAIATQIQSLPEDSPKRRRLINTLVQHNLRLVVRFVKGFMDGCSHNKWGSPETVDYLQTGSMGLMRAAEKFDPKRGYTFATYANFWIRSMVGRYNMKTFTPVSISESASRQLIFYKRNGYLPSRVDGVNMPKEKIEKLKRLAVAAYGCTSLNVELDNGYQLLDTIRDSASTPELNTCCDEAHRLMDSAGITPLGKEVLLGYIVNEETLKAIAERLGISPHKARVEKDRAMKLLQDSREQLKAGIM